MTDPMTPEGADYAGMAGAMLSFALRIFVDRGMDREGWDTLTDACWRILEAGPRSSGASVMQAGAEMLAEDLGIDL